MTNDRKIDFEFFKGIKKLNPWEPHKPILRWCVCEFAGVEEVDIEIEFMSRILFETGDLITESQLDEIDENATIEYLEIYEDVNVSLSGIDKHYRLLGKHDNEANLYFIKKETLMANIRKNIELPSGYAYQEEITGRDYSVIYRIENFDPRLNQ